MVSRRALVAIWILMLTASMVGFAWTQWPSDKSVASAGERYDQSIYKNLDPSFSREHMRGRLISAARKNPGFGGVFLSNRQTVLNIYIAEDENAPEQGINKLYIGVVSEWDVEGVYVFLEGIGIPREATTVEAVEQPRPA